MPTNASEAELKVMMANAAKMHANLADALTGTFVTDADTFTDNLDGQFMTSYLQQAAAVSNSLASGLTSTGTIAGQLMIDYANTVNLTADSQAAAWSEVFQYWNDNNIRVKSRTWSFGNASATGGNTGNGTIRRVTQDKYGYEIQSGISDVRTYNCIADQNTGAVVNQELFGYEGEPRGSNRLQRNGTGAVGNLTALENAETTRYLNNPSFGNTASTAGASIGASVTAISGWTLSGTSALGLTGISAYRKGNSETNANSLVIRGDNGAVSQVMSIVGGGQFDPSTPYYAQLAYLPSGAPTGAAIKFTIGSQTQVYQLSTETGWNVMPWYTDEKAWPDNWTVNNAPIQITTSGLSTGYILIDDILMGPMQPVAGKYERLVGGNAPFSRGTNGGRGDEFTITDTLTASVAYTQDFFAEQGLYLPHSATPNNYTEPSI